MSARDAVLLSRNTVFSVQNRIAAYKRNHPGEPTEFEQIVLKMIDDLGKSVTELANAVEAAPGYRQIP